MPRISRTPGHTRAKRQPAPPTPDLEMQRRRAAVAQLVAMCRPKEDILFMMRQEFPDMAPQAIDRMRAAAQTVFEQEVRDNVHVARAKQRARLFGLLGQTKVKGSLSAAVQVERLLAEIDGTLAPREIVISADAATRDALAAVLSILPSATLLALCNGQRVPLGHAGPNGQPTLTVGGEDGAES